MPYPRISTFPAIDTICQKDTAILRAYTVDSLLWSPATNINCTNCDTVKVYPNITTKYIARAINSDGCKSYDTSLVIVYQPINLQVFPADTIICPGQTIKYNLNTNGIILWSPPTFLSNTKIKNPIALNKNVNPKIINILLPCGGVGSTPLSFIQIVPITLG